MDNEIKEASESKGFALWAKICCVVFVIAAALHSADKPIGGGDTWVAMACGRYSLQPYCVDDVGRTWQMKFLDKFGIHITKHDPFGSESRLFVPGDEDQVGWLNQNWLTHVLFYKMKMGLGENSIVAYKLIQAVLTGLFAFWAARVLGAHYFLASALASFGILVSRSYVDLRPNVSSILFAIIMILLLAYWRRGQHKALIWMAPVMILWSNVHGGFIYAMMIFTMISGVHIGQLFLAQVFPGHFETIDLKAFKYLVATTIGVWVIPAIFSPFGLENMIHPLMIATGDEGKIWRQVVEWRPISDKLGFGNATPYIVMLSLFAVTVLIWCGLYLCKPADPAAAQMRKRQKQQGESLNWPKINLAHLAIMAITIAMSIKSRRFIFLGGVILAPFFALMLQEICNMFALLRARKADTSVVTVPVMPQVLVRVSSGLILFAAIFMSGSTLYAINELYLQPQVDGHDRTMFRRMVGIQAQPVKAMQFVSDNKMTGVVLNEWTNGGFVPFHQVPNPTNGRPPAQVFMDGRAQAAYTVEHFSFWNQLKRVPAKPDQRAVDKLKQLAKQAKLDLNDPKDCEKLLDRGQENENLGALLLQLSLHHPLLYSLTLERNRINIAVQDFSKSSFAGFSRLLMKSSRWDLMYVDEHFGVFVCRTSKANQHLFGKKPNYPNEFTEKFSTGLKFSESANPQQRLAALRLLISAEPPFFVPLLYNRIFQLGKNEKQWQKLEEYFSNEAKRFQEKFDRNERFGKIETLKSLSQCNQFLAQIAQAKQQPNEMKKYVQTSKKYGALLQELLVQQRNGNWLW